MRGANIDVLVGEIIRWADSYRRLQQLPDDEVLTCTIDPALFPHGPDRERTETVLLAAHRIRLTDPLELPGARPLRRTRRLPTLRRRTRHP